MPKRKLTPEMRRTMLADLARLHEHGERREYEEARKLAENITAGLARVGLGSAHISWVRAVLFDYLGELEQAFRLAMEAITLDPVEPNYEKSFCIIVDKLRRALLDPERDPADESTPRLHAMLVQAGKADDLVHVALARHLAEVGKGEEALTVLDAVVRLSPVCGDAWTVKAVIARDLGREEEALAAQAEAAACDGGGQVLLFGIPGQAVA
jgi:tetratricopeptide (TPR) repeat protein